MISLLVEVRTRMENTGTARSSWHTTFFRNMYNLDKINYKYEPVMLKLRVNKYCKPECRIERRSMTSPLHI